MILNREEIVRKSLEKGLGFRASDELNPSGKIGEWTVEASCEFLGTPAAPGLSIYATKKIPGSSEYAKDPLRNIKFDTSHPSSSLFKPEVRLCSERFSNSKTDGTVPVGGIIMWSGSPGSVPAGWALCDGSVPGRPDLRNRFIIGAGSSYSAHAWGGGEGVTIGIDQMPYHAHGFSDNGEGYLINADRNVPGEIMVPGWDKGDLTKRGYGYHSTRIVWGTGGAVGGAGGGQPLAIPLPPWYALAYIMRLE